MTAIKLMKKLTCACIVVMVLNLVACANDSNYDKDKEAHRTQVQEQGSEVENQKTEEKSGVEEETAVELETETELMTDLYGPVAVSELDYDSFQSRMTDEEWEGFQQYFPVLKENAAFHYTSFGDGVELNKNKEPLKDGEYLSYERYASEEMADINRFVDAHSENDNVEWDVEDIRVFDLDADGVQELIIEWTPVGEILVLHREKDEFYGWEIMYRGFEMLQTNGIYISSGGAGANLWKRISFDNGTWLEEILLEEDWGKFYANGEAVDEDTFLEQLHTFETEDVTRYEPMRCMEGVAKIWNAAEDGVMKMYYEMEDGCLRCS